MRKEEMSVTAPDGARLAGTLTWPGEAGSDARATVEVVVMIHGTGALDRNENAAGPGQREGRCLDVFNALARDLAAAGYASLRYDKRGCGASGGDYLSHGQEDLVADAGAWVAALAGREGVGPVYLLGHSEGTIVAPRVAAREAAVAGLILLCPFVQPMEDILMWQARGIAAGLAGTRGFGAGIARFVIRLFGGIEGIQARLIARLRASRRPVIRVMGRRVTARSLRDLLMLDNRAVHRGHGRPTLLVVAGRDVQCPPGDGAAIAALISGATLVEMPDLTHLLRTETGPPEGFAGYRAQLARPIAPEVAQAVCAWLGVQTAANPQT